MKNLLCWFTFHTWVYYDFNRRYCDICSKEQRWIPESDSWRTE